MKNTILIYEDHKLIDDNYFKNYGHDNYSKSYKFYTESAPNIINNLNKNGIYFETILDGGCASGELVKDLRDFGYDAWGIEFNKKILEECIVPDYCFNLDLKNLKNLNRTFDVIYLNSLMYLFPQEIIFLLHNIYNIVNKAIYLYNPYLNEPFFSDKYRKFLAHEYWFVSQLQESNFKRLSKNIFYKQQN